MIPSIYWNTLHCRQRVLAECSYKGKQDDPDTFLFLWRPAAIIKPFKD